ncbi:MAG: PSD1 domain-containing protein [Planctomycetes bacterium]|nr:PSD1 domain-containing protein [Planctomycetota bacterium]
MLFAFCAGRARAADDAELFETTVRPLLHEHCVKCHGPDRQKAELRLDTVTGLSKGGERGALFVAGKPEESLIVAALSWERDDLQMPPRAKLDEAARATIAEWIRRGAVLPSGVAAGASEASEAAAEDSASGGAPAFDLAARKRHWAWQPLAPREPPAVAQRDWPRDPLDAFVLAKLEEQALQPAPDAPLAMWLRRVTFDLTGLPPTVAAQDAFLADRRPDARERVVDALLASPAFGEKWARHWLDLARYAEGRGHEFDFTLPNAWAYRDYLVRALDADVPYDQLLREHVAGDLLDPPRLDPATGANESLVATGFWLLGEAVHSPVDIRGDECDRVANQIDTFSKAFLGVTLACARCHDHKFDAITQRDYYSLSSFLAGASARQAPYEALPTHQRIAAAVMALREQQQRALEQELTAALRPVARGVAERAEREPEVAAALLHAAAPRVVLPAEKCVAVVDAAAPRAGDWNQDGVAFGTLPLPAGAPRFSGDLAAPLAGFAPIAMVARDGALDRVRAAADREVDPTRARLLEPGRVARTRSFALQHGRLHWLVRGKGLLFACVASHRTLEGPLHTHTLAEIDTGGAWRIVTQELPDYVGLRVHGEIGLAPLDPQGHAPDFAVAGLWDAAAPPQLEARANALLEGRSLAEALEAALGSLEQGELRDAAHGGDAAALLDALLAQAPAEARRGALDGTGALARFGAEQAAQLAAMRDGSRVAPALLEGSAFTESLLIRGSWRTPGDATPRRFLEALDGAAPLAAEEPGSGRLALADRLVAASNPLLPRVAVNRIWHHLFGRGLVASVDDLGALGERPSHPELLDTLASDFMRDGWSQKRLIRRLVLSRTYAMSSGGADPRAAELDPANRLLHAMPVRRLTAEQLRDALLSVAGSLDATRFGPAVATHLTPFMEGRGRPGDGPLDGHGRRTLYLSVRRNFLDPFLLAFDFPNPAATCGRRSVSNVPAQALSLMNGELVQELARRTAHAALSGPPQTPAARVESLLRRCFGRPPAESESAASLAWLAEQLAQRATNWSDEALWSDWVHVLFCSKAFLFVE